MKNDIIKIYYDVDETGPAEHLGGRLARIVDAPLLTDEVFVGDIVRLCNAPDDEDGFPRIEEVVHLRFPCQTRLRFDHKEELAILASLLRIVGAECYPLIPPGDSRGLAIVGHCEHVDRELLAEAAGIPQMIDEWTDADKFSSRRSAGVLPNGVATASNPSAVKPTRAARP